MTFNNSATAGSSTNFTTRAAPSGSRGGFLEFHQQSSAGSSTFTNDGAVVAGLEGGTTSFYESSSAGTGHFINNGGLSSNGAGGITEFRDNSSAGNGIFTNNGGTGGLAAGTTFFTDTATADHGTFINNPGGQTFFGIGFGGTGTFINNGASVMDARGGATIFYDGDAENALLIANGGSGGGLGGRIIFTHNSYGGTARVEVFGNGFLTIQDHIGAGVTIGSLEGTGDVFVGAQTLTVGSNNLSTIFSGVIQDGGPAGSPNSGGSLTKIGTGTLTLSGTNTYTGSTTVNAGMLIVDGSVTTSVTVNGGRLGGSGTTGAITVNKGGTLAPGNSPGILNANGNLRLALGSTYLVDLNGTAVGKEYDQTNVTGAVTLEGATLTLSLGFTPIAGSMFTIINNDLNDMVIGIFDGLSEGATFVSGGQAFTITYHGGDGNDVVLNVVPEPQTWVLAIAGLIALVIVRKRISFRNSE